VKHSEGFVKNYVFIAAAAAGLLLAAPAQAGDAAAGAKVFKKCKACHYIDREKNKSGPHLVDIIGRAAGAVDGFKYSKAMAGSGLVWDEATLAGFLAKPKKYLKGTKMSFAGLKKESDIANVIAYLKSPK
jgi:cytochrome c